MLLSLVILAALFVVTGFAAARYHAKQKSLATQWFERGNAELQAGSPANALDDFRNALAYSRGNPQYELRLAQALVAANRSEEARAYLLGLWERTPASGPVNLELARLAARQGDLSETSRYYHNAIYGRWEGDSAQKRWQIRFELCQFWLARGAMNQAQAELISLANDTPPEDAALQVQVGSLFLKADDPARALEEFRLVLRQNHRQVAALVGAGEAAFELNDFRPAERYLTQAVRGNPSDAHAANLLETARLVLCENPFELGLTEEERAKRVIRTLEQATGRLRDCAATRGESLAVPVAQTDLQKAYAAAEKLRPQARLLVLRRHPELLVQIMNAVFATEELSVRECGPAKGADQALLLIEQMHHPSER